MDGTENYGNHGSNGMEMEQIWRHNTTGSHANGGIIRIRSKSISTARNVSQILQVFSIKAHLHLRCFRCICALAILLRAILHVSTTPISRKTIAEGKKNRKCGHGFKPIILSFHL